MLTQAAGDAPPVFLVVARKRLRQSARRAACLSAPYLACDLLPSASYCESRASVRVRSRSPRYHARLKRRGRTAPVLIAVTAPTALGLLSRCGRRWTRPWATPREDLSYWSVRIYWTECVSTGPVAHFAGIVRVRISVRDSSTERQGHQRRSRSDDCSSAHFLHLDLSSPAGIAALT